MRTRSTTRNFNYSAILPPELLELTFQFLLKDAQSKSDEESPVKATSLVCRSWRAPSQRLLLHSISIVSLTKNKSIPTLVANFTVFLDSAAHIVSAVQKFEFSQCILGKDSRNRDLWAPALRPLKNVRHLTVSYSENHGLHSAVDLICNVWSSTMTHLTFKDCTTTCTHRLLAPLSSCTNLRVLDFTLVVLSSDTTSPPCCAEAEVQLHSLQRVVFNLDSSHTESILRWLSLPNVSTPQLKDLEVSLHEMKDITTLHALLSDPMITIWEYINTITLDLNDSYTMGENIDLLFSEPLDRRLSLRPQFINLELFTDRSRIQGLVCALLWWGTFLCDHTSLQTLTLSFRWVGTRTSSTIREGIKRAWGRLDTMLSQDKFPSLKSVKCVDEERRLITQGNLELVELIRDIFPQLSKKGILVTSLVKVAS